MFFSFFNYLLKVKAEKSFSIKASFKGTPTPKVIVKKDGEEVDNSQVEVDEANGKIKFTVTNAKA